MTQVRSIILSSAAAVALSFGVLGCEPAHTDVIPSSAMMANSGNGVQHFTAPADGMVYVFDHPAQRLVWSGKLMSGQSVDIDPARGVVMAGGAVVVDKIAAPADQKDIYFDRAPVQMVPAPAPAPTAAAPAAPNNGSVLVTPNVTVQPANGQSTSNGVTVQPGVTVSPAPNQ